MKKLLTVGIILLFVGMNIPSTGLVIEKLSYSLGRGDILFVGGGGPGNYTKIQDAIDNASYGDTVFVYNDSSPYYERIKITKSINLIGENRDSTIIDGMEKYHVMKIRADYVNISNFNLTNSTATIHVDFASYNTISSVVIHSDWIGIKLDYSPHNTFLNNIIVGNDYGLWAEYSDNLIIHNNNFSSNSDCGIRFSEIYGSLITNNLIVNNDNGISIGCSAASGNRIYHNNFINNSQNAQDWGNNIWDNGYPSCGNYWDDYNGTDADGDGIGDTPYPIPGGDNEDRYPLMEPWGIENQPPDAPNITGPHYGRPGVEYTFCIDEIVDPDGDDLYCMWDWGDGNFSGWLGPYGSGVGRCASHAWSEEGEYEIKVKLKDIYNAESNWSEPHVIMIEAESPHVEISRPKRAVYIRDKEIITFIVPLIFGDIQIWFWAEDSKSGLNRTELYIDDELKEVFTSIPKNWLWDERVFFRHTIMIKAYDNAGNNATKEMNVWKFF